MSNGRGDAGSGGGLDLWLLQADAEPTAVQPGIRSRLAQWVSWLVAGAAPSEFETSRDDDPSDQY
jgi:hypothetical protein